MPNNLKNCNKDEAWLKKELKIKGYTDLQQILLATVDVNEKLQVYERNLEEKVKDMLE